MNPAPTTARVPLVLHVIPSAVARGAQREARSLADHLDRPGQRHHRVLTLFAGPAEVRTDLALDYPGRRAPGVGFEPPLAVRLRSHLGGLDPAVVVAHGSEPLKYLVAAMIGRHRPLAYYAIGTYSGSPRRAHEQIWQFMHRRPDLIIAEGQEVRAECIGRFQVPETRVVFIPNGRDPATFRPQEVGRRDGPPHVVFVGALTEGKRPERFIAAVGILRSRGVPFTASIVGDGPLRQRLARQAESAGIALLGSREDVPDLLREADVSAFTSLPSGEGMPGVLIEAGMSGVPVVATDVPGVRSIVEDGETGVVVAVTDMEALVHALGTLLDDAGLRASMGDAARRHCVSHFGIDTVAAQWSAALRSLMPTAASGTRSV